MKIKQQTKSGIVTEAIKTYDELAEDEVQSLIFAFGDSRDDFADYQVRHNGNGVLLGVRPYNYTEEKSQRVREDGDAAQRYMDAMAVLYGHGEVKVAAEQRMSDRGVDVEAVEKAESEKEAAGSLLDEYLSHFNLTRYVVAKKTGIGATTLLNAARRNSVNGMTDKVISAVAMIIGTEPGKVLNDLIYWEAKRDLNGRKY